MYVELCKNNGTDYLRLVSSRRVIDKNGKKTARKKKLSQTAKNRTMKDAREMV